MDVESEQPASEPAVGEQDSSSAELSAAHEETSIDDEEKTSPAEAGSEAGNEHEQIGRYGSGRATESDAEEWDAELERLGPMREPGEIVAGAQKVRFAAGTHLSVAVLVVSLYWWRYPFPFKRVICGLIALPNRFLKWLGRMLASTVLLHSSSH